MDWEHLFSISPEDLTEEDKDDLFNTITWYNSDSEDVNLKKSIVLFRISQEVLKYKGEQVEILLHKLDELAMRRGEDEVKRQDFAAEIRSSKSRKSSSIEFENLEQKYTELKTKFRKHLKTNEKNAAEIDKLRKVVSNLQHEKNHLMNELQLSQGDNQSDVSESVKDQHKELMLSLHNKNRQISDLLRDIEETERDNIALREKLTGVRDELSAATNELTSLTKSTSSLKAQLVECSEMTNKLTVENENLREELDDVSRQKARAEEETEQFAQEINKRVDEWTKILRDKDREIRELRATQHPLRHSSSSSSLPVDQEQSYVFALNKAIGERDDRILELKVELQDATREMEETAVLIRDLTEENEVQKKSIEELNISVKELKKQVKTTHRRCQQLQDSLSQCEKVLGERDSDIKDIFESLNDEDREGQLALHLRELQQCKSQNRHQEKQIVNLVRVTNELQERCDQYERENEALRDKLGISSDETVNLDGVVSKKKLQLRDINTLRKKVETQDEVILQLKMDNLKLKKTIAVEVEEKHLPGEIASDNQLKALVEENEALRKGLHEILDTLNTRKESSTREIKSETLEQLLRALDVKHISGWYHPAMRLQAELHNLEGMNAELREQLRLERLECRGGGLITDPPSEKQVEQITTELAEVRQQFQREKQSLIDKLSEFEERVIDLQESNSVKDEKLSIFIDEAGEKSLTLKCLELAENNVVLIRKRSYLEDDVKSLRQRISTLEEEVIATRNSCASRVSNVLKQHRTLETQLEMSQHDCVSVEIYHDICQKLDELSIKHRTLLNDFSQIRDHKESETRLLEESCKNLKHEKEELQHRVQAMSESYYSKFDGGTLDLPKKLAEAEARELNEKQRANHINNLFELVKDQLAKCEDKLKVSESQNKDIVMRNLLLQEQFKVSESRLCQYVTDSDHKVLQDKYNCLLQEKAKLTTDLIDLTGELTTLKTADKLSTLWSCDKERELLDLKHQIVDLQASSDDKMLIGKLSSELANHRARREDDCRKILELQSDLEGLGSINEQLLIDAEAAVVKSADRETELRAQVSVLRDTLSRYRLQYLGCIPLSCDNKYVSNLKQVMDDKHEAFMNLYNSEKAFSEGIILKEQYESEIKRLKVNFSDVDKVQNFLTALEDGKTKRFSEIKYKRQSELREAQLKHVFSRVKLQDEQIIKLEEELFELYRNHTDFDSPHQKDEIPTSPLPLKTESMAKNITPSIKITRSMESQTEPGNVEEIGTNLRSELFKSTAEIQTREQTIQGLKCKINELEMNLSLFRKQLGDKQSQITFYERHILELQSKTETVENGQHSTTNESAQENLALRGSIKSLQEIVRGKEDEILKYQTILKEDRDKHSMAAALMREELKVLEKCLSDERQKVVETKCDSHLHPSKAALEQYFAQVHSLEEELCNCRTRVSGLELQLQASRQEAVRWRGLANDRLDSMQKLGKDLEEVHGSEISAYKNESDKWREEVNALKLLVGKYRSENYPEIDVQKIIGEKDDKIHELGVMLRSAKSEARKMCSERTDAESVSRINELELTNDRLMRDNEALKKRFEQLLVRERSAREEIRELKGRLLRKPILSARSDRSDRSIKEQLQKKIASLEKENDELKASVSRQVAINESHRLKISEDFERWNKQKYWQQACEKAKKSLKAKEADFDRLQQTCAGYRILIERLEREKYMLENRVRSLKSHGGQVNFGDVEMLRAENVRLAAENQGLVSKLEMQQLHSGGLGAAMLQDKLEAQERKIAILELASKGTLEVRSEMERLQSTISSLQKANLCLEAENLELKLDLEKSTKESPHLREQIQHLENYVQVLKRENTEQGHPDLESNPRTDGKKLAELERTIFVLKRVVEKLQVENRRLVTGKRPCSDRSGLSEKFNRDHHRLREQYCDSVQQVAKLEKQVAELKSSRSVAISANNKRETVLSEELAEVKEQLDQKSTLLNRVKVLLQRAAAKEKQLMQEIEELKGLPSTPGVTLAEVGGDDCSPI